MKMMQRQITRSSHGTPRAIAFQKQGMDTNPLDELILSMVTPHWQKVAMLISKVILDPGFESGDLDVDFEIVASRIEELIARGRLAVQGDAAQWRYCEVRVNF